MSMLHELRKLSDLNYRYESSAYDAIIDEIRGLRYDLQNHGGNVSNDLTYAIIRLLERIEQI